MPGGLCPCGQARLFLKSIIKEKNKPWEFNRSKQPASSVYPQASKELRDDFRGRNSVIADWIRFFSEQRPFGGTDFSRARYLPENLRSALRGRTQSQAESEMLLYIAGPRMTRTR